MLEILLSPSIIGLGFVDWHVSSPPNPPKVLVNPNSEGNCSDPGGSAGTCSRPLSPAAGSSSSTNKRPCGRTMARSLRRARVDATGGDSADLLRAYKPKIALSIRERWRRASRACPRRSTTTRSAALTVVDLIRTAKVGKCIVLMPYDDDHNTRYSTTVEPAVAKHMIPINLARLPSSEAIYTSFADNVGSASAIICGRHAAQP